MLVGMRSDRTINARSNVPGANMGSFFRAHPGEGRQLPQASSGCPECVPGGTQPHSDLYILQIDAQYEPHHVGSGMIVPSLRDAIVPVLPGLSATAVPDVGPVVPVEIPFLNAAGSRRSTAWGTDRSAPVSLMPWPVVLLSHVRPRCHDQPISSEVWI